MLVMYAPSNVSPNRATRQMLTNSKRRLNAKYPGKWVRTQAVEFKTCHKLETHAEVSAHIRFLIREGFGITERAARAISVLVNAGKFGSFIGTTVELWADMLAPHSSFYCTVLAGAGERKMVLEPLSPLSLLTCFTSPGTEEADEWTVLTETVALDDGEYYPVILGDGPTLDYQKANVRLFSRYSKVIGADPFQ